MKITRSALAHVQPRVDPDGRLLRPLRPGPGVIPPGESMAMDDATTAYQWSTLPYNGDSGQTYFRGYAVLAQMAQGPENRMIVETIAREMTRKRIHAQGSSPATRPRPTRSKSWKRPWKRTACKTCSGARPSSTATLAGAHLHRHRRDRRR